MKTERNGLALANLLLLVALSYFLASCTTWKGAVRKFGHLAKDSATITVRDTVITRKDSVVLRLKTDTSTVHQVIQEGRARIIYDRTHTITQVKAECLPDTVYREKKLKTPPAVYFGVSPKYKTGFFIAIGLILVLILVSAFVLLKFFLKLSIAKR